MNKPVIICVDDEKFVLDSLRTTLLQAFGDNYVIEIAEDGAEALSVVQELLATGREVPVIISDYVMPEMRGDELLRHIQIISQRTLKIMLSGQASLDGVTNAVNEADLYKFVSKPWSSSHLVEVVRKAVWEYFSEKARDDRARSLLSALPDLVLFMDRNGLVLEDRSALEAGSLPRDCAGKNITQIFPDDIADLFLAKIPLVVPHGQQVGFEYTVPNSTQTLHFEARLAPCGEDNVLAVVRDITARREDEIILHAARAEADRANSAKSAFLAAMSHEIRTPLNAVVGFSNLLMETPLNPEQREFAETITKSSESLLSVVNDILDFSKIEAGRIELETTAFDVREAVEDSLELITPEANRKGLEVCSFIASDCPQRVLGDVTRLRQVLTNLLGNSVKFTSHGEIDVSVEAMPVADSPDQYLLRFSVRDTGIGMSASQLEKIFEPFIQADDSTTRRFGGTGLGLTISKRLVEIMGGSISVESSPGAGSTFSFSIPVAMVPDGGPTDLEQAPLAGLRVACVDDNATNRRYLSLQLKIWGATAASFDSGSSFLQAAASGEEWDAVLMDFNMPDRDGLAVALDLKKRKASREVPVILLTSGSQASRSLPTGVFARVFTKPVSFGLLHNALAELAGRTQTDRSPEKTGHPTRHKPLSILLAEDNPSNQKLLILVLGRLGYTPDLVSNGREALEAVRSKRYDVVLMDVQMPELDGIAATRAIRAELPPNRQPTIIALTAHASEHDRKLCIAAGMSDYLTKPLRRKSLKEALDRACEPSRSAAQPA